MLFSPMISKYPTVVYFFALFLPVLSDLIIRPMPCISPSDRQCSLSHCNNHIQSNPPAKLLVYQFLRRDNPEPAHPSITGTVFNHSGAHTILNTRIACRQMLMWVGGPFSNNQAGSGRSFFLPVRYHKTTRSESIFSFFIHFFILRFEA